MNFDQKRVEKALGALLDLHPEGVSGLFDFMSTDYLSSKRYCRLPKKKRQKDASKVMLAKNLLHALEDVRQQGEEAA